MKTIQDPRTGIRIDLPEGWRLVHAGLSVYSDPATPHYNLLLSHDFEAFQLSEGDSLVELAGRLCEANPFAEDLKIQEASGGRALARYRSGGTEGGERKDDRHWLLLERGDESLSCALFTLSVLADRAEPEETESLDRLLSSEIARVSLAEASPAEGVGPPQTVDDAVERLAEVVATLREGLTLGLDEAPPKREGIAGAALATALFWFTRLKALFDEAEKKAVSDALIARTIAGLSAAPASELEAEVVQACHTVMSSLESVFTRNGSSEDELGKAAALLGLRLLAVTTRLLEGSELDSKVIVAQAERMSRLSKVVLAAPEILSRALELSKAPAPAL